MRYDIRILWIEDTPSWRNEQKEIMEMHLEDLGLCSEIVCKDNGLTVMEEFDKEANGFKIFDIFLIDYSLSSGIHGDEIINKLRTTRINSDVLFYSSDYEKDIQKKVADNLSSFEGVYISNRDNFIDKCLLLIEKNAKKMLSISNIRGFLMDQTSENDFVMNSYLLSNYDSLTSEQKSEIHKIIIDFYENSKIDLDSDKQKIENIKSGQSISNIKTFLGFASYIVPLELKYMIFETIIRIKGNDSFINNNINNYFEQIVKKRNTIAHKKLDVCKQQKYIQYYDNIDQYRKRTCPENCGQHNDEYKISLQEWTELRKSVITYANCYNNVFLKL